MEQRGLLFGFVFDGKGGGRQVELPEVKSWQPEDGVLWLHFDYSSDVAQHWITLESSLNEVPAEALLTEESRPRTIIIEDAALIALRGGELKSRF